MQEHRIYKGNRANGSVLYPFAKCLCGAYLDGVKEIEEHEALIKLKEERR